MKGFVCLETHSKVKSGWTSVWGSGTRISGFLWSNSLWISLFLLFGTNLHGQQGQGGLRELSAIRGEYFILDKGTDSLRIRGLKDPKVQMMYFLFAAEEDPIGLDPGLSTDGRWRAIHLAEILRQQEIAGFFSTPFRRNVLTLQPVCEQKQTQVQYYDQADLTSLYNQIGKLRAGDVVLMVHKESFERILEHFTGQKPALNADNQPSDRIFVVERNLAGDTRFSVFSYDIR